MVIENRISLYYTILLCENPYLSQKYFRYNFGNRSKFKLFFKNDLTNNKIGDIIHGKEPRAT